MSWVYWSLVCTPKQCDGLGVLELWIRNLALLAVCFGVDSLWRELIVAKYGESILTWQFNTARIRRMSSEWKKIVEVQDEGISLVGLWERVLMFCFGMTFGVWMFHLLFCFHDCIVLLGIRWLWFDIMCREVLYVMMTGSYFSYVHFAHLNFARLLSEVLVLDALKDRFIGLLMVQPHPRQIAESGEDEVAHILFDCPFARGYGLASGVAKVVLGFLVSKGVWLLLE
ncbi:hypothetical protein V6N11_050211 [Hibiscus sabdariffa]|uniref:Reverse transcriptase zinc-binding domain-containing protein n=1 Tax=Hibiscus sabdariffa TaxID=183260 RepID=A0ABR2T978_9ROSI